MTKRPKEAMIFAAGMGTRLKPLTDKIPKALVEAGGKSLLEHAVLKLRDSGVKLIVVNVHHHHEQVKQFIRERNFKVEIQISDEKDQLLETWGGLKKAGIFFSKKHPVILYNVDVITDLDLKKMWTFHIEKKALATLAIRTRKTSRYLYFNNRQILTGWENTKTGEKTVCRNDMSNSAKYGFSGIHIVEPRVFNLTDHAKPVSLTNIYLKLAKKHDIYGFVHDQGYWYDAGKIPELEKVRKKLTAR